MAQILVFSDSHGNLKEMIAATRAHKPDYIIHLGDYLEDAVTLQDGFPNIEVKMVPGNCDSATDRNRTEEQMISGRKVLFTHGHLYHVKSGLETLQAMGQERCADLLLFGHTHTAYYKQIGQMHMLNPGSIGKGERPSFAKVGISPREILCEHIYL